MPSRPDTLLPLTPPPRTHKRLLEDAAVLARIRYQDLRGFKYRLEERLDTLRQLRGEEDPEFLTTAEQCSKTELEVRAAHLEVELLQKVSVADTSFGVVAGLQSFLSRCGLEVVEADPEPGS